MPQQSNNLLNKQIRLSSTFARLLRYLISLVNRSNEVIFFCSMTYGKWKRTTSTVKNYRKCFHPYPGAE